MDEKAKHTLRMMETLIATLLYTNDATAALDDKLALCLWVTAQRLMTLLNPNDRPKETP